MTPAVRLVPCALPLALALALVLACASSSGEPPAAVDAAPPAIDAAVCGDGMVGGAEACDDGNADDTDGCIACAWARCGDGFVRRGVEDCDDGSATCVRCSACAPGIADLATGHCYSRADGVRPRGEAQAVCAAAGGHLLALDGAGEWAAVAPLWTEPYDSTWLGLIRAQDGQNQWRWEPGAALGASNWNPGEPNDAGGVEDCVEVGGATGIWNDLPCTASRRVLCERPTWATDPATNHAYRVFYGLRTHAEAIADCAALGAHLATITSEAEQTFVRSLLARSVWIGAFQRASETTWFWSTGEPFAFAAWGANQPDDAGANEDCVELTSPSGDWNDLPCTARQPYLCEVN